MANVETLLRRLEKDAQRAKAAETALAHARGQLRRTLEESRAAGASISELARCLGVSRQRVYSLLD